MFLKKVGTDLFSSVSQTVKINFSKNRCSGYKKCYQFLCNLEFLKGRFSKLKFMKKTSFMNTVVLNIKKFDKVLFSEHFFDE